jgi:M6 family metalloprotease-like protein/uncharacterized repeat protein (TIGR01451 family)
MRKMILKMRFGLFAAVLLSLAGTLSAAPFDQQITFKQPDGTMIQLHGWGDEFSAIFETQDGYTVVFDQANQAYCFARQNEASGALVSLGVQAHLGNPAALGLAQHERMSPAARKAQVVARWKQWDDQMQVQSRWHARLAAQKQVQYGAQGQVLYSPPDFTTTGTKVGLTLLVDFSDDVGTIPQAEVISFCNGDNYTGFGNNGSIKQYYSDISGGLLTYTNVVTVYIRVPQPKTFYNDVTKDSGTNANLLIKDALDALKALPNYTTDILPAFNNLTVDANNQAVACNVFFAGNNSGVWMMGLWPHSWSLYNVGAQTLGNGMSVFCYEITDMGQQLVIGTFCHENGHMLCGYPDLYDYGYDSTGGAGNFCLMGNGNYGGGGKNPVEICAYLKRASGWGNSVELNSSSALLATAGAAATTGTNINQFYRYQKHSVPTEYYLIENRQQLGHDAAIPASGLAIWHVDELGDRDNQSTNYNATHANYECSLVQADNLYHFQRNINSGDANDLYYASNTAPAYINAFTDASSPSAFWWDGTASGLRITSISAASTNMTFFVGTYVPPIVPKIITAPQPSWGTNLSVMNGTDPNGDWVLFVQDDKALDSGVISNGWFLTLTTANPVGFSADNQIIATPGSLTNVIGAHWNLTLAVTNFGPSISSNVYVSDALPLGLTLVASNTLSGTVSQIGSRLLTWKVGTLAVGAGATLNLDLTSAAAGVYTNTATVAADTADANADDDSVSSVLLASGSVIAPQLTPSFSFSGGKFLLGVSGSPVSTVIQASTNLSNWVPVYTNTPPFVFTNLDSTNYPARFYRAVTGL